MNSPTIRDIAQRAGVDGSTVSLALRNDHRLPSETRERIQKLAIEMGYRRNPVIAQLMTQLRAGRRRNFQSTIAVIDLGVGKHAMETYWEEARRKAYELGYGLEFFHAEDLPPNRFEQVLVSRGIRGAVICSVWKTSVLPSEYSNIWSRLSCCVVGVHPRSPALNFVADDNFYTSVQSIEKLHEMGFRRIGLVLHKGINEETEYRFMGGFLAAREKGEGLERLPYLLINPGEKSRFLAWFRKNHPEAVVCVQTEIYDWLVAEGYHIPDDVSLVHLDCENAGAQWAGMNQMRGRRMALAVEVVINQLNQNETGVPPFPRAVMPESVWRDGSTTRAKVAETQVGESQTVPRRSKQK